MKNRKKQLMNVLKVFFPLLLMILAIFEIQRSIRGMDINLLRVEVSQLQQWKVVLILIFSFCAITPMFLYDIVLMRLLRIQMKARKLIRYSFIVNTFSNIIGFGGIVGLMLRNYFFSKYRAEKSGILKNIASVTLFYLTGISLLSWLVLFIYRDAPLLTDTKWLLFAVIIVCLYLPLFLLFYMLQNRKNATPLNSKIAVKLVGVSLFEWVAIFLFIWFLTIVLNIPIGIAGLIPIFLIASCAGIVSMIPGGIGSFDLVFLWGTQSLEIPDEKILVLLFMYRMGYFVIPFLSATLFFVQEYLGRREGVEK
ncbi:lysylphosphatidylglycerol synthase domain-containing protein [Sporosarcina limicola]|uniref:Phosphatidylglycerol lysyltransferase n=1 Tax=Sporosarcina limicola TaxID=34101 RepID=A0A927MIL4_9BACL|nr:lysylphosphatidylglycerol synthase domain-containing protein [Sporosarcina limicola]MBE1553662.1 uncharacterized membrane protein YbhN (UPF0104 family) [Sporosarcina limicola]